MLRLDKVIKPWKESAAFNDHINLYGFWSETAFLTKSEDLGMVVVRVGSRVRGFKPGDQVYARPPQDRIGSFAELISMNEDAVAIMPKKLTMEEAASIPLVGLTAWQALIERANLKKGQKVLIHAGSGGVGTFAIQLAKHLGHLDLRSTRSRFCERHGSVLDLETGHAPFKLPNQEEG